jgi:cell division protein FtsX
MDLLTISAVIIMLFGLGMFVRAWVKGKETMNQFGKNKK